MKLVSGLQTSQQQQGRALQQLQPSFHCTAALLPTGVAAQDRQLADDGMQLESQQQQWQQWQQQPPTQAEQQFASTGALTSSKQLFAAAMQLILAGGQQPTQALVTVVASRLAAMQQQQQQQQCIADGIMRTLKCSAVGGPQCLQKATAAAVGSGSSSVPCQMHISCKAGLGLSHNLGRSPSPAVNAAAAAASSDAVNQKAQGSCSSSSQQGRSCCQVAGCAAVVPSGRDTVEGRYKVCQKHRVEPAVVLYADAPDALYRFCNRCFKFEPIANFDGSKRGCRASLARRRQKQLMRKQQSHEQIAAAMQVSTEDVEQLFVHLQQKQKGLQMQRSDPSSAAAVAEAKQLPRCPAAVTQEQPAVFVIRDHNVSSSDRQQQQRWHQQSPFFAAAAAAAAAAASAPPSVCRSSSSSSGRKRISHDVTYGDHDVICQYDNNVVDDDLVSSATESSHSEVQGGHKVHTGNLAMKSARLQEQLYLPSGSSHCGSFMPSVKVTMRNNKRSRSWQQQQQQQHTLRSASTPPAFVTDDKVLGCRRVYDSAPQPALSPEDQPWLADLSFNPQQHQQQQCIMVPAAAGGCTNGDPAAVCGSSNMNMNVAAMVEQLSSWFVTDSNAECNAQQRLLDPMHETQLGGPDHLSSVAQLGRVESPFVLSAFDAQQINAQQQQQQQPPCMGSVANPPAAAAAAAAAAAGLDLQLAGHTQLTVSSLSNLGHCEWFSNADGLMSNMPGTAAAPVVQDSLALNPTAAAAGSSSGAAAAAGVLQDPLLQADAAVSFQNDSRLLATGFCSDSLLLQAQQQQDAVLPRSLSQPANLAAAGSMNWQQQQQQPQNLLYDKWTHEDMECTAAAHPAAAAAGIPPATAATATLESQLAQVQQQVQHMQEMLLRLKTQQQGPQ